MAIPTSDVNDHYDAENVIAQGIDSNTTNISVANKFEESLFTKIVPTNTEVTDCNKSSSENDQIKNTLNDFTSKFNSETSLNIIPNITNPTSGVNDHNDEDNSMAMEVDIISTNTTLVHKIFGKTLSTNRVSINTEFTDCNKSSSETDQIKNTLNKSEPTFDNEISSNLISEITIPTSNTNYHNNEENSMAIEVDIKSTNTSLVDKIFDETLYTNRVPKNTEVTDFNKSSIENDQIKNILNDSTPKFNNETSLNIIPNITNPTSDVNDHNDEDNSNSMDAGNTSTNTTIVDKILDDTIGSKKCSTSSRSIDLDISLNETESPLNDTEPGFVNNIQNANFSAINVDGKLHLSKLDKSIVKNSINSNVSFVENREINITCNTSLEDPSYKMRQYLDFEQAVNEMCNNITSTSGPERQFNKSKYDDKALEHLIEQTLSSDILSVENKNENFSNYDGSNLSVIVENKTLEDISSDDMEQNKYFENPESKIVVNEIRDSELLNKSTFVNNTTSQSEAVIANETDDSIQIETNANKDISMKCTIIDSGLVENMNESSIFCSDELLRADSLKFTKVDDITTKQILMPENINEIHSNQNTLEDKNAHQTNVNDIPKFPDLKLIPGIENIHKNCIDQDELLTNDPQQELLDKTKSINNSLEEFTNLEEMFNFGDCQKVKQSEYKTPKIQKLLDFSIVQQTPTEGNPIKKQKLLNFSIVDQTPISKSVQNTSPNKKEFNKPSLLDFSSVDEINLKKFQNSANAFSSNNISSVSAPGEEFYSDESNFSNSTFNQTITDSNLNMSTNSCASNKTQNTTADTKYVQPSLLINKQISADTSSNSLNETIEQIEYLEKHITSTIESNQNTLYEASTEAVKSDSKLLSNYTLNKNIESSELKVDKQLSSNSNEPIIMDFSITEQGTSESVEFKNYAHNVCNLVQMSHISKSNEQLSISSENQLMASDSSSDEINNTTQNFEESTFSHNINTALLTDIQINDVSLLAESPEKSSIIDSFHSVELDNVHTDNKRKIEATHEYDNNEKKMKVESDGLKTPMSMLYKIKNMFRSSEKQLSCVNNTKENNFKSGKCHQKLNFGKLEETINDCTKPMSLRKPEVLSKSKIPCKVTRSSMKNDESHSSQTSLIDSVKQKKTIPKFTGITALSDVSNSSSRKCTESRIPSKFHK